jgi:NADH-quinone oxidoreductase subunit L
MLAPLGVLALGAVFAGMIWHNQFFGDHERMVDFFDMPAHAEEAAHGAEGSSEARAGDGEAEPAASATATPAEAAGEAAHAEEAPAEAEREEGAIGPVSVGAIAMSEASEHTLDAAHHSPWWVKVSPFVAMLLGLGLAYVMYVRSPDLPGRIAATNAPLHRFLLNAWYFDRIYDAVFVRPAVAIGRFFWRRGDGTIIDGTINGVAMGIVPTLTRAAGRAQSGYVFHYAFVMVIAIAAILSWFTITGGVE